MEIMLFNEVCICDVNKTIIYGQYKCKITSIEINPKLQFETVFSKHANDFYIKIHEKISHINEITFKNDKNDKVIKKDIAISFPFEKCDLALNADSAIISTMCKHYSSRLEEWIEYHLNLGFSGIVIFDNDENKVNKIHEPLKYLQNNGTTSDICEKFKGKVWCVKFNYTPLIGCAARTIQRIALHIGVNALRNRCGKIALIDADEFIHVPKKSNIIDILSHYKGKTLTMKSNILTNKSDCDIIDNNILDLCIYVGENKYTKTILDTSRIKPLEFINTPHKHPSETIMDKNTLIHYHCWVNSRYNYSSNMPIIKLKTTDK